MNKDGRALVWKRKVVKAEEQKLSDMTARYLTESLPKFQETKSLIAQIKQSTQEFSNMTGQSEFQNKIYSIVSRMVAEGVDFVLSPTYIDKVLTTSFIIDDGDKNIFYSFLENPQELASLLHSSNNIDTSLISRLNEKAFGIASAIKILHKTYELELERLQRLINEAEITLRYIMNTAAELPNAIKLSLLHNPKHIGFLLERKEEELQRTSYSREPKFSKIEGIIVSIQSYLEDLYDRYFRSVAIQVSQHTKEADKKIIEELKREARKDVEQTNWYKYLKNQVDYVFGRSPDNIELVEKYVGEVVKNVVKVAGNISDNPELTTIPDNFPLGRAKSELVAILLKGDMPVDEVLQQPPEWFQSQYYEVARPKAFEAYEKDKPGEGFDKDFDTIIKLDSQMTQKLHSLGDINLTYDSPLEDVGDLYYQFKDAVLDSKKALLFSDVMLGRRHEGFKIRGMPQEFKKLNISNVEGAGAYPVNSNIFPLEEIGIEVERRTLNDLRSGGRNLGQDTSFPDYSFMLLKCLQQKYKERRDGEWIIDLGFITSISESSSEYKMVEAFAMNMLDNAAYHIQPGDDSEAKKAKAKKLVDDFVAVMRYDLDAEIPRNDLGPLFDWVVQKNAHLPADSALEVAEGLWRTLHNYFGDTYKAFQSPNVQKLATHPSLTKIIDNVSIDSLFEAYVSIAHLESKLKEEFHSWIDKVIEEGLVPPEYKKSLSWITHLIDKNQPISSNPEVLKEINFHVRRANAILNSINEYKGISMYSRSAEKKVPQITEAVDWEQDNFRFRALKDKDPMHFLIGDITDCCQILGGAGEAAAVDSFINKLAGVLVVELKTNRGWEVAFQSYFHYVPESNGYILDNIEYNQDIAVQTEDITGNTPEQLYSKWANYLKSKDSSIEYILLGKNYTTIDVDKFKTTYLESGDPRTFHDDVEDPYSDFSASDAVDLLSLSDSAGNGTSSDEGSEYDDLDSEDDFEPFGAFSAWYFNNFRPNENLIIKTQLAMFPTFEKKLKEMLIRIAKWKKINTQGWNKKTLSDIEKELWPSIVKARSPRYRRMLRFARKIRTMFKISFQGS